MTRSAHTEEQDVVDPAQLLVGDVELPEGDRAVVGEPSAHRVGKRFGRLVDLLEHEVGIATLLRLAHVPVDVHDLGIDRHAVQGRDLGPERRHRRDLALAEHEHALRVRDDRGDIGRDVVLVVADSDDERRVETRTDQQLGVVAREHGQRVGSLDALQSRAHGGQEIALVVGFDEVRHDLGVRIRGELVPRGLELAFQLGEVFDDSVVDHEDLALAVRVRVGVDVGRLPVGRPARVAYAQVAAGHVRFQLRDQGVDLGLGLGDAGPNRLARPGQLEDGYARRVVAPVLEALEAFHEDRRRFTTAEVADDPAHLFT